MTPFTYTPTAKRTAGFAWANAKSKAAHDAAQPHKPEAERVAYTVTDEEYAHAALDRVADSYCQQQLEEAIQDNRQLLSDSITFLSDAQKSEIRNQVAAAKLTA